MKTFRIVLLFILVCFAIWSGFRLVEAVTNLGVAEKNLGYEYGRCVFYDQISVEQCNKFSENKGLPMYEKYYGDGSWTVENDPVPEE